MGLRLYEYGLLVVSLVLVGIVCFILAALYSLWPQPWRGIYLFGRAAFLRYINVDWFRMLDHIADRSDVYVMSSYDGDDEENSSVVSPVGQPTTTAGQLIAMPGNAGNGELSDNAEIIFQAKIEVLALLIREDQITMTRGLELVFGRRSSKPNSPYHRARQALEPLLQKGPQYRLTPEQEAWREELGLPVKH